MAAVCDRRQQSKPPGGGAMAGFSPGGKARFGIKAEGLFDNWLESWKAGSMKTTMDLPEDLIREMKFRAVREGRKLRDVAEEVLRRGLAASASSRPPGERHRVRLPIIPASPGARPFELTGERLMELELEAEQENANP